MSDSDYEHWPKSHGYKSDDYVYTPARNARTSSRTAPDRPRRSYSLHSNEEYEHWPSRLASARHRRVDSDEYLILHTRSPRRHKPEYIITRHQPDDDPTSMVYVPATKARSPSPVRKPTIWLGRTKEEVKRDNDKIAASRGLPPAPKVHRVEKSYDDDVWVVDTNGELSLRSFGAVMDMAEAGEGVWKANPEAREHPYFALRQR